MIKWRSYFKNEVVEQGLDAVKKDQLRFLRKISDDTYTCTTTIPGGMRTPKVKILPNEKLYISCSCKHFENNDSCIHTATLCAAIEIKDPLFFGNLSVWGELNINSRIVDPFSEYELDDTYFSVHDIFSDRFLITQPMVDATKRLINMGRVTNTNFKVSSNSNGDLMLYGSCSVFDGVNLVDVNLNATQYDLCQITCEKNSCSDYQRKSKDNTFIPCIHKLVLCMLTAKYIFQEDPCIETNNIADRMIKLLRKNKKLVIPSHLKWETSSNKNISICAIYNIETSDISFQIGSDKYYVVRDLTELLHCYLNRLTLSLGKSILFDFSRCKLTQQGLDIITFIKASKFNSRDKKIHIDVSNIEKFYNLCCKEYVYDENMELFNAEDGACLLKYDFKIDRVRDSDRSITVLIKFPMKDNYSEYAYSINPTCITRMKISDFGILSSIYPENEPYMEKLIFGRNNINEFYISVLPELQKYGVIDNKIFNEDGEWKGQTPTFSFFLDYADSIVTCSVHAKYKMQDYILNPYENKRGNDSFSEEEEWIKSQVELFLPVKNNDFWASKPKNNDQIFDLLNEGIEAFRELGEVNVSDSLKKVIIKRPTQFKIRVSLESNLLDLNIDWNNLSGYDIVEILKSYRLRKRYHKLKDGEFIDLSGEDIKSLATIASEFDIPDCDIEKEKITLPSYLSPYLDNVISSSNDISFEKNDELKNLVKRFSTFKDSQDEVPSILNANLRPYQKEGFRWLKTLYSYSFGGILADEMGLGKTIQVITLMASLKESDECGVNLVVCPSSLVYNWEAEIKKFVPSFEVMVVSGIPSVRRMKLFAYKEYDVVITSYDSLKRDTKLYEGKQFNLCFLDEAQYIKNYDTEAAKSVKLITAKVRFALTGTPIENRLSELWSIFSFLMPGYLYSYDRFRREIEVPIMKERNQEASIKLKKMVSPFILRRQKKDVLKDLPEKLEEVSLCELTGEQRRLYDAKVVMMKNELEQSNDDDFKKNKLVIFAELTRLRQICCDPALAYENFKSPSSKLLATLELVERAIDEGHRILLFSQFTSMLSRIAHELDERKIEYYTITGATAKEERLKLVNSFNEGQTPIFLISLKAGGTGLNLTGADVVIHYDPWWNGAVQDQATDRAHRIGQTRVVTVYSMIAKDTIEEKIIRMQESKKDLAQEILSGEHVALSSLSKEDLLELLS